MIREFQATPIVLAEGFRFTESPHWRDDLLWFSDMHADTVFAIDKSGVIKATIEVPGGPNGLGWMPDGRMLIVCTSKRQVYRVEGSQIVVHGDMSKLGDVANPLNDMCVDDQGGCYVGEFGLEIHGWLRDNLPKAADGDLTVLRNEPAAGARLFYVSPQGVVSEAASGLRFPNGSTTTQDSRLVVAESLGLCMAIFPIDSPGVLGNPVKVDVDFIPDGVAQPDRSGGVWVADPVAKSVALLAPDNRITARIFVPRAPYACAVDLNDPDKLFLCTSSTADPELSSSVRDSAIEAVDLAGLGLGRGA